VEIVHNIVNTINNGSFQIKLDQTESYMHFEQHVQKRPLQQYYGFAEYCTVPLVIPEVEPTKKFNLKEGRFSNSSKMGKNIYV